MEYKRLTHRNGENIEEYCEVGHCKYAEWRTCNFKGLQHNVDEECVPAMIERLAELEDKIEQGTLVDTEKRFIVEDEEWGSKNKFLICKHHIETMIEDFCPTREEAEKRLEELKK